MSEQVERCCEVGQKYFEVGQSKHFSILLQFLSVWQAKDQKDSPSRIMLFPVNQKGHISFRRKSIDERPLG